MAKKYLDLTGLQRLLQKLNIGTADISSIGDGTVKGAISSQNETFANINNGLESCLKSVSDGKSLLASTITAYSVSTASDATFTTMANNIVAVATNHYNAGVTAGKNIGITDGMNAGTKSVIFKAGTNQSTKTPFAMDQNLFGWNGDAIGIKVGGTYHFAKAGYNASGTIHVYNVGASALQATYQLNDSPSVSNGGLNLNLQAGQWVRVTLSATSSSGSCGIVTVTKL